VFFATEWAKNGTFRDVVKANKGVVTLGIGTRVGGRLAEGISVSTLNDLTEFVQMGVNAERLTGKRVLPASAADIRARVAAMRNAQPAWIWAAVAELERAIRDGKVQVPLVLTKPDIQKWRKDLG